MCALDAQLPVQVTCKVQAVADLLVIFYFLLILLRLLLRFLFLFLLLLWCLNRSRNNWCLWWLQGLLLSFLWFGLSCGTAGFVLSILFGLRSFLSGLSGCWFRLSWLLFFL